MELARQKLKDLRTRWGAVGPESWTTPPALIMVKVPAMGESKPYAEVWKVVQPHPQAMPKTIGDYEYELIEKRPVDQ
jgi:hypothetical protein